MCESREDGVLVVVDNVLNGGGVGGRNFFGEEGERLELSA